MNIASVFRFINVSAWWQHVAVKKNVLGVAIVVMCSFSGAETLRGAETISAWTYHDMPPFIVNEEKKEGLTYDFAELLNKESQGKYMFVLEVTPKKRLESYLTDGQKGILLWAVSLTFGGIEKGIYDWTDALISDQQDFISLKSRPVEYNGQASSLFPYRLGGVLGHIYFGIQDEIDQGKIVRKDVYREEHNIHALLDNRIDVASMANTAARYYVSRMGIQDQIHFSAMPLNSYTRHIMMPKHMPAELRLFLKHFVQMLPANQKWQAFLAKYGLN